jgi:protein lifeguard
VNDDHHTSVATEGLLHQNDGYEKFCNREDRLNFVKKVYSILAAQLLFTAGVILIPLFSSDAYLWMRQNIALIIVAFVGEIITSIALLCCRSLARSVPTNYILLGIFTLCEAYIVAFIAARFQPQIVLIAAVTTAGMTIGITVYAFTTKADFTIFGPILFVIGFTLAFASLFFIFYWSRAMQIVWCIIGVILFSFYLLFDTQLIMGGKRYEIEIDDYIVGAIILYTDIITIFIYLLRIFGDK